MILPLVLEITNHVNRRNIYGKYHLRRLITLWLVRTVQSKYFRESTICNLQECVKNELTE